MNFVKLLKDLMPFVNLFQEHVQRLNTYKIIGIDMLIKRRVYNKS